MKCNYITHRSEGIFVIYLLTLFCPNVHGQMSVRVTSAKKWLTPELGLPVNTFIP